MDNFRDSYFNVTWDLTKKHLRGTFWGKQYDTGRGFTVTVINGGQVVSPTNEVLRLKWEKPDNTSGYVQATIISGKFVIENIDQMFTVAGSVRADLELSVGGEFVASITFYVNVEKAVAVDAIESSSQFTALQEALADVGDMQAQVDAVIANATVDSEVILARGTEPTLGARLDGTDAQLAEIEQRFGDIIVTPVITEIKGFADIDLTFVEYYGPEGLVAFFDVYPDSYYTIELLNAININRFRVVGFKNRNYKTDLNTSGDKINIDHVFFYGDDSLRKITVKTPSDIYSIGLYLNNASIANPVVDYSITYHLNDSINDLLSRVNTLHNMVLNEQRKFFTLGTPSVYFSDNDIDPTNKNNADILAYYQSVESSPLVTKIDLGKDRENNSIYEYTIEKPKPNAVDYVNYAPYVLQYPQRKKMKILLISGIHGDEKGSALGLALFFKKLVEDTTDENLKFIRDNAILKFIPVGNPIGMNYHQRTNGLVDINRDFVDLTQPETLIIKNWVDANTDAIALLDYHNSSRTVSYWPSAENQIYHELFYTVMGNINDKWSTDNPSVNNPVGELIINPILTNLQTYANNKNMIGLIVEGGRHSATINSGSRNDFDAMAVKYGNDLLINTLIAIMNYYK